MRAQAKVKKLRTVDATCPLVNKIHVEIERFAKDGKHIIYIGHRGHPEAVGVMGIRPDIRSEWLNGKSILGITAGASAPEHVIQAIATHFKEKGAIIEDLNVIDENMKFTMPYELNRHVK